ncbi:MAG: hypothetical protein HQL73_12875 [Magnetococcales bacterium]|nr:hypothetical protein [Magnetococcales bacterium]
MEFPFIAEEALALEQTWLDNCQSPPPLAKKHLIAKIAASLLLLPEELPDPVLQIPKIAWKRQQLFLRYRVAIHAFLWLRALLEVAPDQARALLLAAQPLYNAAEPTTPVAWSQIMADVDFFSIILDNYQEEGFLSISQHVVWRVHGDFVQHPEFLEIAVALAFHIDQQFEEFRTQAYLWAGRHPPQGIDRVTSLLDSEAFSGNF